MDVMNENERLERLKIWVGFFKFFIGTVAVGLITTFLNHQIQQKELSLKEKDLQQEYLKNFIAQALDENLEKRVRFAHYFSTLLKDNWTEYHADLRRQFQERTEELKKKEAILVKEAAPTPIEKLSGVWREIASLRQDVTPAAPANLEDLFNTHRADELELARLGETAFHRGQYDWTIRLLRQADAVAASRVWQSAYPFLICAYYIREETDLAEAATNRMFEAINQPYGYLTSEVTLGFLLNNFGAAKPKVSKEHHAALDAAIDRLITLKNVKREQEASLAEIQRREQQSAPPPDAAPPPSATPK